jgi:hypothetical protein
MSAKRPYKIAVGGDHYMVTATTREQAGRIALGAYPSPVVEVTAASPTEVMEWLQAGKQIFDKDTFVARSIPTVVLYCTSDGQIAADTEFRIEPGNYHLVVERMEERVEAALEEAAAADEALDEHAAPVMSEADMDAAEARLQDADIADAEAGPEDAAELQPEAVDGDVKPLADMDVEEGAALPAVDLAENEAPIGVQGDAVPGCGMPTHRGAFAGDIFYGDPEDSTRGTHIWRKGRWNAYMRSDDDKIAE